MGQVTLKNIHKNYDGHAVIKGIDLDVKDGEFLVFVGPSGCGKSTTLRMIAGLENISEGDLLIDGQRVNDRHPAQRGAAMVFQSYALYPHMTVSENMGFALKMSGIPTKEREAQVRRAADVLRIEHMLQRYPKELSGGERQRVAIGRAIVRQPKVFLFDEPLSNLDAALRVNMRIELTRLHKELGTTMIYVTHDQVEAMTMGDRIAVFNQGIIEQLGSPMTLYHKPANHFVAGFLGSPKINLVSRPSAQNAMPQYLWDQWSIYASAGAHSLGLRPEHVQLDTSGRGIPAELVLAEHLGDCTIAHLRVQGSEELVRAKLPFGHENLSHGQMVSLMADFSHLLSFDEQGKRCI
ncbi:ABC transporter ATP-binding protein [Limnohabitans sp. DM1]|uniref:ABC transporter ATP-binding protein n=1 Tax=Limnohabitans sp. DM1 TaxID=1597955 RepID=UPI000ADD4FF3|nr:sn-glycerol-3-phosphate ABC transporter ATP-binding protein UgpC [Limnohabitans sp. DM1]